MKIFVSHDLDEFTFRRVEAIAEPCGITFERADTRRDLFILAEPMPAGFDEQLGVLQTLDSLTTCARSIRRLIDAATDLDNGLQS